MSVIKRDLYTSRNPIYTALYFILTVQFYGVLIFAGHVNEKGMWNILLVLGGKKAAMNNKLYAYRHKNY